MKRALTHADAAAMLERVAQGSLSETDERAVVAHAATCPQCAPTLAALRARSGGIKSEKEVSIIAPAGVNVPGLLGPRVAAGESRLLVWYSVGVTIIAIASIALLALVFLDRTRLRTANDIMTGNQAVAAAQQDSVANLVADRDRLVASLTGPRVRVVTLSAPAARSGAARVFWDQSTNRWTMFAHFLPTPREGRTYQLWLVSKGRRLSAGTFTPDANGDAVVRAENALAADALAGIIVTDEPAGGVTQPTGPVVMSATGR